jgi:hypothetical protein
MDNEVTWRQVIEQVAKNVKDLDALVSARLTLGKRGGAVQTTDSFPIRDVAVGIAEPMLVIGLDKEDQEALQPLYWSEDEQTDVG